MKENNLAKESRNAMLSGVCTSSQQLCSAKDKDELNREFKKIHLIKTASGLGFTIVSTEYLGLQLLQIKTVLPNGPADIDGQLKRGDVMVCVDSQSVRGFNHSNIVSLFQAIPVGRIVTLEICRGYPPPFDSTDPNTEVITTVAVTHPSALCHPALPYPCGHACTVPCVEASSSPHSYVLSDPLLPHSLSSSQTFDQEMPSLDTKTLRHENRRTADGALPFELDIVVVKGVNGFGFTIGNSSIGQKIKQIIDFERCKNLAEGDIVMKINGHSIMDLTHSDVVEILKNCSQDEETLLGVRREGQFSRRRQQSTRSQNQKQENASGSVEIAAPSETDSENSKTLNWTSSEFGSQTDAITCLQKSLDEIKLSCSRTSAETNVPNEVAAKNRAAFGSTLMINRGIDGIPDYAPASAYANPLEMRNELFPAYQSPVDDRLQQHCDSFDHCNHHHLLAEDSLHRNLSLAKEASECLLCKTGHHLGQLQLKSLQRTSRTQDFLAQAKASGSSVGSSSLLRDAIKMTVRLDRGELGFGIRIIGGSEEGSQVAVGCIVPGGAADVEGHIKVGDEIVAVNQQSVVGASHHHVVSLMSQSAQLGFVILDVLKKENPKHQIERFPRDVFDVILTRKEDEGFGFVIVSSVSKAGSIVGKIIDGSPASCCEDLKAGDYILAINGVDIGSKSHQEIINQIKASGLSIVLTVAPVNSVENNRGKIRMLHYRETGDTFHLIKLKRGSRGFGFSIRGGKEFGGMPLYILKVADDGPAKLDGRLQIGDQVIEINGHSALGMMHSDAIDLMQNSRVFLILLVKRSSGIYKQHKHRDKDAENCENMMTSEES